MSRRRGALTATGAEPDDGTRGATGDVRSRATNPLVAGLGAGAALAALMLVGTYLLSDSPLDPIMDNGFPTPASASQPAAQRAAAATDGVGDTDLPAAAPALSSKLADRVRSASTVLDEITGVAEGIPQRLLAESQCVAVIPGVIKVGFGFGGRHGKGLVSCRSDGGWSTPSFVAITGGSFGLQIGAQSSDLVLVFVSRDAVASLGENKITLGGDASVSAGPVGRTAEAGTTIELESEIYSYSRSKGLFAGMSLEGATLRPDEDANREVYGPGVGPAELLSGRRGALGGDLGGLLRRLESAAG